MVDNKVRASPQHLAEENARLRARLAEAEETLEAIRSGAIDALVVRGARGDEIYTLSSADRAFRELAERMTDGAATIGDDGTILWANTRLANLAGRPLERMVGANIATLSADDRADVLERILDAGRFGEGSGEIELLRHDGAVVPVRVSVTPVSVDSVAARAVVISDLTEHRRVESVLRMSAADLERLVEQRGAELAASRRELEEAEDRQRRLLETVSQHLPVGLLIAEPDGRIVYSNEEAERLRAAATRTGEAGKAGHAASPLEQALAGGHVGDTETTLVGDDGRSRAVLVRAEPVCDAAGDMIAAVCVLIDITARRDAEQMRDAFIDVTAHELKTPLTTIYGGIHTLVTRDPALPSGTRHELLADVCADTDRLVHLVDDLLVLSRVERGVEFVIHEPLMLNHIAREVVQADARREGGLAAEVRATGDLPPVQGERTYVEQVITNLLRNAGKYGRPPIEVVVEGAEGGVSLRVLDNGPGFSADASALFELYYREPSARKRAGGGGIGLFVCRELVRMMGGRIWAANRPGGGAEFGFFLPTFVDREE